MPKILRLDANEIRALKKMTPGEYGERYKFANADALKFTLSKGVGRFDAATFDSAMQWYPSELARIHTDQAYFTNILRMDAGEAAYFARQLEYVKARTRDVKYPENSIRNWIPISGEAGPAADSIAWRQFDSKGKFALSGDKSKDAPRVDISAKEDFLSVKDLEAAYGYTIMDIRKAMYAGLPLGTRLANAARLAYEQSLNDWGWNANGTAEWAGARGFIYMADVLNSATLGLPLTGNWCDENGAPTATTPNQILADINLLINYPRTYSKKVHKVNTVAMPTSKYSFINTTMRSELSDKSILEIAQSQHPGVRFGEVNELSNVIRPSARTGSVRCDVVLAYENSEENISLEVPQAYEEYPVVFNGKEYVTTCHYRIGGTIAYYPASVIVGQL